MLLCIDIGNTNTIFAVFADDRPDQVGEAGQPAGQQVHSWRVKTDPRSTPDELGLLLRGLLAPDAVAVTGVAACSTVPSALRSLRGMLARYYPDVPAVIVEPGTRTGVPMSIDNPKEAGADRVVNTLAAYTLYGGPSIVVDFGTSTNFDVVGPRGEYLGGVLTAGIEISIDALASRAAQLRHIEPVKPPRAIGKSTVECLQSGVVYGFAGQVDGIVRRVVAELGGSVQAVVATGGLASVVIDECETVTHHEPMLTLIGLRLVYQRNT